MQQFEEKENEKHWYFGGISKYKIGIHGARARDIKQPSSHSYKPMHSKLLSAPQHSKLFN